MKIIKLYGKHSNNSFSLIDDDDFEKVNCYRWSLNGLGYAVCYSKQIKDILLHRFIMNSPNSWVDHKDRNPLNNQKINLRLCNRFENNCNRKKPIHGKTSQYKGVSKDRNSWVAYIYYKKKQYRIGVFKTEKDAALAYNKEALKLHKEFAVLNEI